MAGRAMCNYCARTLGKGHSWRSPTCRAGMTNLRQNPADNPAASISAGLTPAWPALLHKPIRREAEVIYWTSVSVCRNQHLLLLLSRILFCSSTFCFPTLSSYTAPAANREHDIEPKPTAKGLYGGGRVVTTTSATVRAPWHIGLAQLGREKLRNGHALIATGLLRRVLPLQQAGSLR